MKKVLIMIFLLIITTCSSIDIDSYSYINEDSIFTFNYKGSKIKYFDEGEGNVLLFIHGLGASSYTWRYLSQYYKSNYRVICMDLEGFGESSKPTNKKYKIQQQSRLVNNFIQRKNLNNVTLIGNSFGGTVVLHTYLNYRKLDINKIILLDSAAYTQKFPTYISLLRTPVINRLAFYLIPHKSIAKWVLNEIFYNKTLVTTEMITTYGSYMWGTGSHTALIGSAKSITSNDVKKLSTQYRKIKIPVLIIWGDKDTVTRLEIGERLHQDIENSTFRVIKNCGHIPQEEEPEKTIAIINDFLIAEQLVY